MTEDEMVGWHHQFNGHEFEPAPGDSEGQGSLACCSPWGCKESEMTEQLNSNPAPCVLNINLLVISHLQVPEFPREQKGPSFGQGGGLSTDGVSCITKRRGGKLEECLKAVLFEHQWASEPLGGLLETYIAGAVSQRFLSSGSEMRPGICVSTSSQERLNCWPGELL